jgi:hypothetical protein
MVEIIVLAIIIFIGIIAYKWVTYISGLLQEVTTWYESIDQTKPTVMPLRMKHIREVIGQKEFRKWLEHLDSKVVESDIIQLSIDRDLEG